MWGLSIRRTGELILLQNSGIQIHLCFTMIDLHSYNQIKAIICLKHSSPNPEGEDGPPPTAPSTKSYKIKVRLQKKQKSEATRSPIRKSHSILDHMMNSDYEFLAASSCRFNEINRYVIQEFVNKIRTEIESNEIYDKLLEAGFILEILDEHERCYINHQQFSQLIEIILDYMAVSKNYVNKNEKKLPTNLKLSNLSSAMASRWLKLKNEIYFNNKDSLKVLEYIYPKELKKLDYDHSFFDLKFDFTPHEVRQVAAAVKTLCKYDIRAFCYLTNYLYLSCISLEKSKAKLSDIDLILRETLKMLDEQNLPAQPFEGEESLVEIHKDFKVKLNEYPRKYINLNEIDGVHKMEALENYIERRVGEAINVLYAFNDLVKNICLKYGYHYLSSLKLKDKTEKMALNRVVEKILVEYSKKDLERTGKEARSYSSIDELANAEYQQYQQYIRQLMNNINEPIEFKVSDLLRSKCMFANAQKLNRCLTELKEEIESRGYKIIQLKNRLKKKTTDILIKLLIQQTTAEIQLAIDFKVAENEFNHKIYELRRSELFTPLTMLKQLNEKMSNNYFKEMRAIITSNVKVSSTHEYFEDITFGEIEQHFGRLIKMLPLTIDFNKPHRNQIDINLMSKQIKRFAEIKEQRVERCPILNKLEKLKRNGEYMYEMKSYLEAEKWLERYCTSFKSQYTDLNAKVSNSFMSLTNTWHNNHEESTNKIVLENHEKYLIRNYAEALHLISKINTDIGNYDKSSLKCGECKMMLQKIEIDERDDFLGELEKNIGWNSFKKGNYAEAIRNFENYLFILQDIKGTHNMDFALILNNIGLVHEKSGNYNESLNYFEKSLAIEEAIKGKYSIEYAATLENIGLAYLNQGYYAKAIQIFQKCLEIEEKVMGKDSINCAETLNNLGNVYSRMGKSEDAILYYKRCLLIEEKVKGKQYIDYAMILHNIGLIFFNEYNYEQALKYYQKCLNIKQKVMGKSNIDLIPTLTNIGLTHANRGEYPQALKYYRRCLSIQEKTNNKDNIDYSNTLNNMAIVEKQLGNYLKAAELLERAMVIVQNIEGDESIDYAFLMASLAEVYFDQENYSYSLVHYEISLENMVNIFGRESIDCANLLNCIGEIHCKLGNFSQALKFSEESLHLKEKIRGREKVDCASCLNVIAEIAFRTNRYEQSEKQYQRSLMLCNKSKVEFIDYGKACLGLGLLYEKMNRQDQSKHFKEQGFRIYSKLKPKVYAKMCYEE